MADRREQGSRQVDEQMQLIYSTYLPEKKTDIGSDYVASHPDIHSPYLPQNTSPFPGHCFDILMHCPALTACINSDAEL